jgi:hypothetical protein
MTTLEIHNPTFKLWSTACRIQHAGIHHPVFADSKLRFCELKKSPLIFNVGEWHEKRHASNMV